MHLAGQSMTKAGGKGSVDRDQPPNQNVYRTEKPESRKPQEKWDRHVLCFSAHGL